MSKKIFFLFTWALVVALLVTGTASAAPGGPLTRPANRIGMITATGSDSFTIQTSGGNFFTVKVTPTTQYQRVNGGSLSFANLGRDQWVAVIGTMDRNRILTADTIVLMPARINQGRWIGKRAYGTVLQVDPGGGWFTLKTKDGTVKFTVDDSTHFTGHSVRNFNALQAGMHAVVGYRATRDGTLYARAIGAY